MLQKPESVSEDPLRFFPLTFQDIINKRILNSSQCFQLKYSTYDPQLILLASLNSLNYLIFIDKDNTKIKKIQELPIQASFIIQMPYRESNSIRCIFGDLKNMLQQIEINLNTQKIDVFNQPNVNEKFQDMIQSEIFVKWSLQHRRLILLTNQYLYLYHLNEHSYSKTNLPIQASELIILPFTPHCNCILFITRDSLIVYNQAICQWEITPIGHRIVYVSLQNQEIHVITDLNEILVYKRWVSQEGYKIEFSDRIKTTPSYPKPITITYDRENQFQIEEQDTQNPKEYQNQVISSDGFVCMKYTI